MVPAERGLQQKLLAAASLDRWMEAWEKVARLLSRSDRRQSRPQADGARQLPDSPIGDALTADGGDRSSVIMSSRTYYVTTPIYYVNDVPHIGHAYTSLACDVLARFKRLDGYDVHFLTGTDEHGQKVEKAAAAAGLSPQAFTDKVSQSFRDLVGKMNYSPDNFIRTTEPRHYESCQALWEKLVAVGRHLSRQVCRLVLGARRDLLRRGRNRGRPGRQAPRDPDRRRGRAGSRSRRISSSSRPGPTGCSSSTRRTRASSGRTAGATRS